MLGWGETCSLMERVFLANSYFLKEIRTARVKKSPHFFHQKNAHTREMKVMPPGTEQNWAHKAKWTGGTAFHPFVESLSLPRKRYPRFSSGESTLKKKSTKDKISSFEASNFGAATGLEWAYGGAERLYSEAFRRLLCILWWNLFLYPKNVAATRRFSRGYFGGTFYSFGGIFGSS